MIVEIRAFRRYKDTPLDPAAPVVMAVTWPMFRAPLVEIAYFPLTVWERELKYVR